MNKSKFFDVVSATLEFGLKSEILKEDTPFLNKKNFLFQVRKDRQTIVISSSKNERQRGNFLKLRFNGTKILFNHYYALEGKIYCLESQPRYNQPNWLTMFEQEMKRWADYKILLERKSYEGIGAYNILVSRIVSYLKRLQNSNKKLINAA